MPERWISLKDVVDCGDYYEVSDLGNVRNVKTNKKLKYRDSAVRGDSKGYGAVCLYFNGRNKQYSVHRLVALAFIPNPESKLEVNHLDGNKRNNVASNLEWATPKENIIHSFETKLHLPVVGSKKRNAKLTEANVVEIKKLLMQGKYSTIAIGKLFNVSNDIISRINRGTLWTHVYVEGFVPHTSDRRGESQKTAKLNEDKVRKIRELYSTGNYTYQSLADMFGVAFCTIGAIIKRKAWKHI